MQQEEGAHDLIAPAAVVFHLGDSGLPETDGTYELGLRVQGPHRRGPAQAVDGHEMEFLVLFDCERGGGPVVFVDTQRYRRNQSHGPGRAFGHYPMPSGTEIHLFFGVAEARLKAQPQLHLAMSTAHETVQFVRCLTPLRGAGGRHEVHQCGAACVRAKRGLKHVGAGQVPLR